MDSKINVAFHLPRNFPNTLAGYSQQLFHMPLLYQEELNCIGTVTSLPTTKNRKQLYHGAARGVRAPHSTQQAMEKSRGMNELKTTKMRDGARCSVTIRLSVDSDDF